MRIHSPAESFRWLKSLYHHRRNQCLSRSQLEAAQLAKFRRLVQYLQAQSPYYTAVMRERNIDPCQAVPTDFPILTKQEVAEHFDQIVTDRALTRKKIMDFLARSSDPQELLEGRYHVLHTSGTSGTIGCFVYDHEDWIKGASHVVRASSLRLRRRVAFVAATRGHFAGVSLILAGNDGTNRLFYEVKPMDVGLPLPDIVQQLNQFQPHVITGYATVLLALGEAREQGQLKVAPEELGSGGEHLSPSVKARIEAMFGVPVKNGYASSEHLYMAMTLPGAEGLHLLEDDLIFELDAEYTCVTNLFNRTLPLIRYRMDDVLVPLADGSSRYPYRRIHEVIGRREELIVFKNEQGERDFIHPIVIVELVVAGLVGWQIVLTGDTTFYIRVRLDPALDEGGQRETMRRLREKLISILADKGMRNVQFEIETVDALPVDSRSGKFRMVIRETQPDQAAADKNDSAADTFSRSTVCQEGSSGETEALASR